MNRKRLQLVSVLVVAAMAGACGKSEGPKPATQVVAKVNNDEITVYQLNNALARRNLTPESEDKAKRETIDSLIDRQLAKQQAAEQKLDRTPAVLAALEAARTEIMARAYVEQVAASQPQPTAEEVRRYYIENPALFAQRRIYTLEEITLDQRQGLAAQLRDQLRKARSMQDVAAWLKSQHIAFREHNGTRAAEQLPMVHLPAMHEMRDGEMRVFEADGGLQVVRLAASKPMPLDEQTAAPRIRQYLVNQRATQAVAENMKRLKENARIEYVGEFASRAAAAPVEQAHQQSATRPAGELAPVKHDADSKAAAGRPEQLTQETIEKGVRGLR